MLLFKVTIPECLITYDTYKGFVVYAETEEEAIQITTNHGWGYLEQELTLLDFIVECIGQNDSNLSVFYTDPIILKAYRGG